MPTAHVGTFFFNPIGLIFPFAFGAAFGICGGVVMAAILKQPVTFWNSLVEAILGGLWWATSAVFPQLGFPIVFIRSAGGALLVPALYELFVFLVRHAR
jgi:hypothetical protein